MTALLWGLKAQRHWAPPGTSNLLKLHLLLKYLGKKEVPAKLKEKGTMSDKQLAISDINAGLNFEKYFRYSF